MDYIQTSNKVADKFGVGAHGFGPGDPAAGQVATYLSPDWCNGVQQELMSVILAGGLTPDGGVLTQLLQALTNLFDTGIRYYPAGQALPTADRGPIWSADFNSVMTWQVFDANGAAFEGYASHMIGALLADTQPTPRAGYVASGAVALPRAGQYAALRAWAQHNGVMVAVGAWAAGRIACADNADGTTFRVYDVRSEFPRFWDAGRGVVDQGFGQWLADEIKSHGHALTMDEVPPHDHGIPMTGSSGSGRVLQGSSSAGSTYLTDEGGGHTPTGVANSTGGAETRPRSTALLAAIKF